MCLVKKFTFIQCIVKINVNLKGVKKPNRKGNKSGSLDQAIKPNVRTIFPIKNKKNHMKLKTQQLYQIQLKTLAKNNKSSAC